MISDRSLVELIHDHVHDIRWFESNAGGMNGDFNGVSLHISGGFGKVTLVLSIGFETYTIVEPLPMHAAPLGKFIRCVRAWIGRPAPQLEPAQQSELRIQSMLRDIAADATNQCMARYTDKSYSKKLRMRLWNKLTDGI